MKGYLPVVMGQSESLCISHLCTDSLGHMGDLSNWSDSDLHSSASATSGVVPNLLCPLVAEPLELLME